MIWDDLDSNIKYALLRHLNNGGTAKSIRCGVVAHDGKSYSEVQCPTPTYTMMDALGKRTKLISRTFPEELSYSKAEIQFQAMEFMKAQFPKGLPSLKELLMLNAEKDVPPETAWIWGKDDEVSASISDLCYEKRG